MKNLNLSDIILIIFFIIILFVLYICIDYQIKEYNKVAWKIKVKNYSNSFYYSKKARTIGDNCLFYQHESGGFPKNIHYHKKISKYTKSIINFYKAKSTYATTDNDATTTEIIYLAKLYSATHEEKYKEAVLKGINFLFDIQYKNGGFPQTRKFDNHSQETLIAYNDNVMINVTKLMKMIADKKYPFEFVDDCLSIRASISYSKALDFILKSQVVQNGKLTAWAMHYDENYNPRNGRIYELASISAGIETAQVLLFLMSIDNPSQDIIDAINYAVEWLDKVKITHTRKLYYINKNLKLDYIMVYCKVCKPIWARFYDLNTNQPFFSDRTGKKFYDIKDIEYERRMGYNWYLPSCNQVFDEYKLWKERINSQYPAE